MRHRFFGAMATATLFATAACWNPFASSPVGSFVWTVNAQEDRASSNGFGALRTGGSLSLSGNNCGNGSHVSITVTGEPTAGATYGLDRFAVNYTPDARISGSSAWEASTRSGSGSLTVSSVSSSRISGSMDVVMAPLTSPGPGSLALHATFDLPFGDNKVC